MNSKCPVWFNRLSGLGKDVWREERKDDKKERVEATLSEGEQ